MSYQLVRKNIQNKILKVKINNIAMTLSRATLPLRIPSIINMTAKPMKIARSKYLVISLRPLTARSKQLE